VTYFVRDIVMFVVFINTNCIPIKAHSLAAINHNIYYIRPRMFIFCLL